MHAQTDADIFFGKKDSNYIYLTLGMRVNFKSAGQSYAC